jgi:hypothetical protein
LLNQVHDADLAFMNQIRAALDGYFGARPSAGRAERNCRSAESAGLLVTDLVRLRVGR